MITINLMGGLGNQLFQIATIISYCIQNNTDFVLPYSEKLTVGVERPTYWNNLFSFLKKYTTEENPTFYGDFLRQLPKYNEPDFMYNEIPGGIDNIQLMGYFQSYKYFDDYRHLVLSTIGIPIVREQILEEFSDIYPIGKSDIITISIHFRLGDYKEKQQFHPVLPYEYYECAFQNIPSEYLNCSKILYFCEEEDRTHCDNIIQRLCEKYHFTSSPKCIDHNIHDWKQLLIMSHCKINIIANSSYSWWAAYLNDNPKKIVIYPSIWFGSKITHNTVDMFPKNWIKISWV